MITPTRVSVFGWIRSATQVLMIARSGNMHTVPMRPVKVIRWRGSIRGVGFGFGITAIMEGSKPLKRRDIVTYGHPRTQGSDRPAARAAGGVSVPERGG